MIRRPPRSPLFPNTPPSRSGHRRDRSRRGWRVRVLDDDPPSSDRAPNTLYARPQFGDDAIELLYRVYEPDRGLDLTEIGEHTSELQSRQYLVCRLLLEKKNN